MCIVINYPKNPSKITIFVDTLVSYHGNLAKDKEFIYRRTKKTGLVHHRLADLFLLDLALRIGKYPFCMARRQEGVQGEDSADQDAG